MSACEPLATSFDDTESAVYYQASKILPPPDTMTVIKVMTWNIRFGAARRPWFGDACGDRVIFTKDEIENTLQGIANKINEVKPDILLLQEVDHKSKRSSYVDELLWIMDHTYFNYAVLASQWKSQFIPSDGLGRMDEGNAILSRWGISDAIRIQLPLRNDQSSLVRYFYERCCMLEGKIVIPHLAGNGFYVVNIHASAFATDDTKKKHIEQFKSELDRLNAAGSFFIAGGDLNTLPPGSDTTDYCIQDACEGESFHHNWDNPYHKDGSWYTPEQEWLVPVYNDYQSSVPLERYRQSQYRYFTHTTRPTHFWDRTLDYLFSNSGWVDNSGEIKQEATALSDHAPLTARYYLPVSKSRKP